MENLWARWDVKLVSVVIAGVLLLQAVAVILKPGPWGWPFSDYPMYSLVRHEGHRISEIHTVHATFADESERAITADDLNVSHWLYQVWIKKILKIPMGSDELMKNDENSRRWPLVEWAKSFKLSKSLQQRNDTTYIMSLIAQIEERHGKQVVQIRVEDYPALVTRDGMKEADAPEVVRLVTISDGALEVVR